MEGLWRRETAASCGLIWQRFDPLFFQAFGDFRFCRLIVRGSEEEQSNVPLTDAAASPDGRTSCPGRHERVTAICTRRTTLVLPFARRKSCMTWLDVLSS
jgi:hypothetical protein